jgi:hypothetical protein
MVFPDKILVRLSLALAVFGTLLVRSAAAQESSGTSQSTISFAKDVRLSGLTQAGMHSVSFQSNQMMRSLAVNHHALSSAPPADIASVLASAKLPSASLKRFSVPGISKANFLTRTTLQPAFWRYFSTPGVDTSRLRGDKPPGLGSAH